MSCRFQVLTNILPYLFIRALCVLCGENALALVAVSFLPKGGPTFQAFAVVNSSLSTIALALKRKKHLNHRGCATPRTAKNELLRKG
jgi:hypothetical protein